MFELGKDLFDGVQIGRVFGQEEQLDAGRADQGSHGFPLVAAQIVHDDDVAFPQRGHENFFDGGSKAFAVDRSLYQPRATIRSWRKAARNVVVFQRPCGTLAGSLWPRSAHPPQWRHVSPGPGLVDKDEALRLDAILIP